MSNYSGSPQLNERQLALAKERKEWTTALGKKLSVLFAISVMNVIILVITFIISMGAISADSYSEVKGASDALIVILIITVVLAIIYGVTICSMGKYNEELSSAGPIYIADQICSVISNLLGRSGAGSLFNLISLALSIVFVLKFCAGMISCFEAIASSMASTWESFKTVFLVSVIGMLASVFLVFMPGLAGLAVLGVIGFTIMSIVVAIWQIVILRQSATEMLEYTYDPARESRSNAGAFRNVSVGGSAPRPVPAPKKPSMTREEARIRAEEMRKRREAKTLGIELNESSDDKSDISPEDAQNEEYKIKMLKEYKELLDSGALTQEEFDAKKKELLG